MSKLISDSYFDLPSEPPLPFGSSPFEMKGVTYKAIFEFSNSHFPGGKEILLQRLQSASLARFCSREFNNATWYDAIPMAYLAQELADLRGVDFRRQIIDSNRHAANSKIGFVYNTLLKAVSSQMLATAIPRAAAILHNFGSAKSRVLGPREVEGVRTGVPRVLVRWLAFAAAAYIDELLRRSGAKDPRLDIQPAVDSADHGGIRAGMPLYDVCWTIRWA